MKHRTTTSDSSSCREQLRRGNAWQRLGMVLLVAVMMLTAQTAWADSVTYIDASGAEQTVDATQVTAETAAMGTSDSETWYYVSGDVENDFRIELSGTVNLILADGCYFQAYSGLHLVSENTLNIFVQSGGTGSLRAWYDSDGNAAIGGNGGEDSDGTGESGEDAGDVNIYGGVIDVAGNLGGGNGGTGYDSYYDPEDPDSYYEGTAGDGGNGGIICIYGGRITVYGAIGGGVKGYGESYDGQDGTAYIMLSWTNVGDNVYAPQYNGEVTLEKDFIDEDGNNYAAGMIDNNDVINEKTLLSADATLFLAQAEPTCTEDGYTQDCWFKYATQEYYTDEACTHVIAESEVVIPALGHNMTHTEAQGATFTTGGNVEYWHCSRCNHYFGDADGENDLRLDDASSLSYAVEGNATDGYSIRMPRKGTATLTIDSSVSSFKIYDDGGVGASETDSDEPGNYSNNCDGYLVLTAPQGYTIQLTGDLLTESYYDYLTVYAGTTTGGNVLLDEKWSDVDEGGYPVPTDIGTLGAPSMMLYFYSDGSDNYDGLDLTVKLIKDDPFAITIQESSGGSATGPASAKFGAKVTLTATPTGSNLLSSITVKTTATNEVVAIEGGTWYNNTATFTMPAEAVTVTATFSDNKDNLFINMPQTGTLTATIPSGITSVKIYDDGGVGGSETDSDEPGNYSNNCDGYLVLTAPQGYTIQLTGGLLTESDCDYLTVYAGTTTDGDVLLDEMSSYHDEPEEGIYEYIYTEIDQEVSAPSMLLYFYSDGGANYDGLNLTATLVPPTEVDDWAELKAACEAGGTVKLTNDVTRNANEAITIENNTVTTVDLNGYTIRGYADNSSEYYNYTDIFSVTTGGSLTITDGSEGGTIANTWGADAIQINNNGSATMTGGTIRNTTGGVYIDNNGSFTMTGGTITGNGTGVSIYSEDATFTVSGNVNITGNEDGDDVCLRADGQPIHIGDDGLAATARIGVKVDFIMEEGTLKPFTSGLRDKGTRSNFVLNKTDDPDDDYYRDYYYTIVTTDDGELALIRPTKGGSNTTGGIYFYGGDGSEKAIIDASSTETLSIPEDKIVYGFTYDRTFNPGKASTVMLPISCRLSQTAGGTFYQFGGVKKENGEWVAEMSDVWMLKANTPYLFVPDEGSTSMLFPGINTVVLNTGGSMQSSDADGWVFQGTYEARHWYDGTDGIHNAENADEIGTVYGFAATSGKATDGETDVEVGQFVQVASGASIKPTRAYLKFTGGANARGAAAAQELPKTISVRLVKHSELTGISDATRLNDKEKMTNDHVYDLQGRRISPLTSYPSPLKKGLYIVGGKKVVIK